MNKIGWVDFIVLPKFKVLIEISRHTNSDDIDENTYDLSDIEDDDNWVEDKPFADLTADEMTKVWKYFRKMEKFKSEEFLVILMKRYDKEAYVISENHPDLDKLNDYIRITKDY